LSFAAFGIWMVSTMTTKTINSLIASTLSLVTLAWVAGCSAGGGTGLVASSASDPVAPVEFTRPSECGSPFSVKVSVKTSPVVANAPVVFELVATRCSGNIFQMADAVNGATFESGATQTITKTYSTVGSVTENFVVSALDGTTKGFLDAITTTQTFTVTAAPGSGGGGGGGSNTTTIAAPNCVVSRVPGAPVLTTDAAMPMVITTTGQVTSILLNGKPAPANTALPVGPVAANSGVYIGSATVTGPGGSNSCNVQYQTPVCAVSAQAAQPLRSSGNAVGGNIIIIGTQVVSATIDGRATGLTSPSSLVYEAGYAPGTRTVRGEVKNVGGDAGQCAANYNQAALPALTVEKARTSADMGPDHGYAVVDRGDAKIAKTDGEAMFGAGAGGVVNSHSFVAARVREAGTILDIINRGAVTPATFNCPDQQVVVGYGRSGVGKTEQHMHTILCAPLRYGVTLGAPQGVTIRWGLNSMASCPPNTVLTGSARTVTASPGNPNGTFNLVCRPLQ
jgi:hypothetical protein